MSVPFFFAGMALRFYQWFRVPRSEMNLCIFGQKKSGKVRWAELGKDSFMFPQVLDIDRKMWGFIISLHLAGVALFIGHLRLIFEFTPLVKVLGDQGMERFAFLTGGIIGIILLITALYFLIRRLTPPGKNISAPEDYFLLILVLLVIFSGDYMRFFGHVQTTVYREYVSSIFSFNPYIPMSLDASIARWSLGIHLMFANMLIFYFPLSKLIHLIGSFSANLIRSEYLWISSYRRP